MTLYSFPIDVHFRTRFSSNVRSFHANGTNKMNAQVSLALFEGSGEGSFSLKLNLLANLARIRFSFNFPSEPLPWRDCNLILSLGTYIWALSNCYQ